MTGGIVKLVLRLPAELHAQLRDAAAARTPKQSLNSEIVSRLTNSLGIEDEHPTALQAIEARLDDIERRVLFGEQKENE
jgi:hypothetical protein